MFSNTPFLQSPKLIFHGTYHKMGTVWMMRVLEKVAAHWKLCLQKSNEHGDSLNAGTDILFANHSHLDLQQLGDFAGSHMIRDPRDCVVSGYFYHLWTEEAWARQPQPRFDGRSYQQHLQSLNQSDGLAEEIRQFCRYAKTYSLREWDYDDERIFEIKYEDLLADEQAVFTKLFEHYGFSERAVQKAIKLAEQCSFEKVSGRVVGQSDAKSHLRSGRPGQWKDVLSERHLELIEDSFGDLIRQMGYI
ncbi:sulfotransferase domain-containing protein [Mariniblastus fucicola]|uniref:Sulfotransferase domain protein n=1 Tax=Mariniblastus fucicola TaxID=980251 RepID=A0A5B9PIC6_9BACT|nr:sulfotransferase domain-containing protein [Mariniblastus fucicola]QEG25025.1 Sulfotransferase domain protein [Mariniblastus fucicola]